MAIIQNKRKTGNYYETLACEYLHKQGVIIIERNFRVKSGEIDIVGKDKDTFIFVEVKYRKNSLMGNPYEAVTYNKKKTICRVAVMYKQIKKLPDNGSFRFDVISILDNEITWYKNAFPYIP